MTTTYNRSRLYNFCELTEEQQAEVMNIYSFEPEQAEEETFVKHITKTLNVEFLPLSMFMRTEGGNNFTHGIYGVTAFSGYYLTLNRSNDEAVIAYKYF